VDVDEDEDVDATDGRSWPMGLLAEIVTRCQPQQQQQLLPWLLWFLFPFFFLYYFSPQIRFEKFMPLAVTRRWKMKPKGDAPSDLRVIRLEEPLPLSPFLHI